MKIETIATDLGFVEGPVWAPDGTVWVTSITESSVYHLAADGAILDSIHTGGGANGLTIDAAGTLYVAQNGGIWGGKPGTDAGVQTIVDGKVDYLVRGLDAPNDLCFGPDGRLYITDSRGESDPLDPDTAQPGRLYVCDIDGSHLELVLEGPRFINGIAFAPDARTMYLTSTTAPHQVWHLPFSADTGVGDLTPAFTLHAGFPDGMAVDRDGRLWIAATVDDAIQVYTPGGDLVERVQLPPGALPTNLCFGGAESDVLYVSAAGLGQILKIPVSSRGTSLYTGKA